MTDKPTFVIDDEPASAEFIDRRTYSRSDDPWWIVWAPWLAAWWTFTLLLGSVLLVAWLLGVVTN